MEEQSISNESTKKPAMFLLAIAAFILIRLLVLGAAEVLYDPASAEAQKVTHPDVKMLRWDSGYYREIADPGYPTDVDVPPHIAFFPLYPLTVRYMMPIIARDIAMVVVANIAAVIGSVFLFLWARRVFDDMIAFWCVLLAGAYPSSMFLSAGYTEGLFFMEVAIFLWLLQKDRIFAAAIAAAFATATRPTGIVLTAVLTFRAFQCYRTTPVAKRLALVGLAVLISAAGIIAYEAYLWHTYGSADVYLKTQAQHWPSRPRPYPLLKTITLYKVWDAAYKPIQYLTHHEFHKLLLPRAWNGVCVLATLAIGVFGVIRPGKILRETFLIPILIFLIAFLSSPGGGKIGSLGRFQVAALPVFLLAAGWVTTTRRRAIAATVVVGMLAIQIFYVNAFIASIWTG